MQLTYFVSIMYEICIRLKGALQIVENRKIKQIQFERMLNKSGKNKLYSSALRLKDVEEKKW